MTCDVNALFASASEFDSLTEHQLLVVIAQLLCDGAGGGGGGSSGVAAVGSNYDFVGSGAATSLRLKNYTTGLHNQISSDGEDGVQSVMLGNGG